MEKTIFKALLCLVLFSSNLMAQSHFLTQNQCGNFLSWNGTVTYWANDQTVYNGTIYKAKWWTLNQIPSADPNGPWLSLGTCTETGIVNPETLCNGIAA